MTLYRAVWVFLPTIVFLFSIVFNRSHTSFPWGHVTTPLTTNHVGDTFYHTSKDFFNFYIDGMLGR